MHAALLEAEQINNRYADELVREIDRRLAVRAPARTPPFLWLLVFS